MIVDFEKWEIHNENKMHVCFDKKRYVQHWPFVGLWAQTLDSHKTTYSSTKLANSQLSFNQAPKIIGKVVQATPKDKQPTVK